MNTEEAVVILKLLLDGVDPETGEIFEKGHVCLNPQVMRALHTAIIELTAPKATALQTNASFPVTQSGRLNAGRPWTDADDEELEQLYHAAARIYKICRVVAGAVHSKHDHEEDRAQIADPAERKILTGDAGTDAVSLLLQYVDKQYAHQAECDQQHVRAVKPQLV